MYKMIVCLFVLGSISAFANSGDDTTKCEKKAIDKIFSIKEIKAKVDNLSEKKVDTEEFENQVIGLAKYACSLIKDF